MLIASVNTSGESGLSLRRVRGECSRAHQDARSPGGRRGWPHRAAPASRAPSATISATGFPYAFEDLGEQSVKNIARSVRVYALHPEGIAGVPTASVPSSTSSSLRGAVPCLSIIVLPFTNLSDYREQQYFVDGITEDLTIDLARLAVMLVISRNTAFTYCNKSVDTKQIGRELCVRLCWKEASGDQATGSPSTPS
jgi:hypothetical protein